MIKFKNVVKKYGKNIALNNMSWSVDEGEIHGLLGHNGSGKTTSFLVANRMTKFDEGEVKVFNKRLVDLSTQEIQKIGLLTEELKLYKDLTISESLSFFCEIFSIKGKKDKIKEISGIFDFENYIDKKIKHLSTGMYKKVVIAITFINDPYIVFLDEPFSGLDPVIVRQITEILKFYKKERGTTIVVSSHNLHEIEEIADQITIMKEGKNVISEKIGKLYSKYDINKSYSISYLNKNEEINEKVNDEISLADKLVYIRNEGFTIIKIQENKIKLTDIYNKIYGKN